MTLRRYGSEGSPGRAGALSGRSARKSTSTPFCIEPLAPGTWAGAAATTGGGPTETWRRTEPVAPVGITDRLPSVSSATATMTREDSTGAMSVAGSVTAYGAVASKRYGESWLRVPST